MKRAEHISEHHVGEAVVSALPVANNGSASVPPFSSAAKGNGALSSVLYRFIHTL
jgi:hypothetical protein